MRHATFHRFVRLSWIPALCLLFIGGCTKFRDGDILVYQGEAYTGVRTNGDVIWTKALSREQIREGREIEKLWLAYCRTNK